MIKIIQLTNFVNIRNVTKDYRKEKKKSVILP